MTLKKLHFKLEFTYDNSNCMTKDSTSVCVAKNTGYLYVKLLVSMCFTLYTTRIVLGALGASDFGIFGVLGSAIAMLGFLNASMAASTQRFMNYYEGRGVVSDKTKIYNSAVIIHVVIALFVGLMFLLFEGLMFNSLIKVDPDRLEAARWIYRITIVSTMITIMTVPYDAVVNSHEDMLFYSIVGIVDVVLKFFLALYVTITPYDKLIVYGLTVLSVTLLTFFLMYAYCKRKYQECEFKPRTYFDKLLVKEMFLFGGWSLLGTSSTMVSNYGIGIVINSFFGTVINATQSICNQFTGIMLVLSTNLMKAVNPVIVKKEGKGDREKMFETTFLSCKLSYLTYVLIGIPFFMECDYILKVWLEEIPPYCLQFCQLVFILKLLEQITMPLNTSIAAVGQIKAFNIVISIIQLLQIVLVVVFFLLGSLPYFSIVAMIVAAFLSSVYKILFCYIKLSMDLNLFMKICWRCFLHLVLCVLIVLILDVLMHESFIRLMVVTIVSFAISILVGYIVLLNNTEQNMAKNVVLNIKSQILHKND